MPRYYYLLRATIWLLLAFCQASWRFNTRVSRSLALPEGLRMSAGELRRFKHYVYGTTYLAVVMCGLRGRPRSSSEKYLFDNLAALAFCFDDLVDSFSSSDDSGILWQDNPEAYGIVADKRGLAQHLLDNIYQALPEQNVAQYRLQMHRVFNVEISGKQNDKHPGSWGIGELEKTTAEKGGCSVLLFRSVLSHPLSKEEGNALFQFGYLIQLCDDIFDLWHDRQAGAVTLPTFLTTQGRLNFLNKIFEQQVTITHHAFRQLPYPRLQISTGLYTLHFLVSITRVCLYHYQNLGRKHKKLPLDNRTAMVVDMKNWSNRFRAAGFLLQPFQQN